MIRRAVLGLVFLTLATSSLQAEEGWWAEVSCKCSCDGKVHCYKSAGAGSLDEAIANDIGQLEAECEGLCEGLCETGCETVPKLVDHGFVPSIKRDLSYSAYPSVYAVRVCMWDKSCCRWIQFDVEGSKCQVHEILRQLRCGEACFHYCVIKNCCEDPVRRPGRRLLGLRGR